MAVSGIMLRAVNMNENVYLFMYNRNFKNTWGLLPIAPPHSIFHPIATAIVHNCNFSVHYVFISRKSFILNYLCLIFPHTWKHTKFIYIYILHISGQRHFFSGNFLNCRNWESHWVVVTRRHTNIRYQVFKASNFMQWNLEGKNINI